MTQVALVDDHSLLRTGLARLVESLGFPVLFEADTGKEFIEIIGTGKVPDVVLLDINMPEMDGYETARWIRLNKPDIKVLALSMYDNETSIIRMLKCGARGYILKDAEPAELRSAIEDTISKGFHYSELVSGKLVHAIKHSESENGTGKNEIQLSEREINFLKYACTELTYKEIADKMFVSPRTIDGYRDALFEKLQAKTRVGLALYAIRTGIVDINRMHE